MKTVNLFGFGAGLAALTLGCSAHHAFSQGAGGGAGQSQSVGAAGSAQGGGASGAGSSAAGQPGAAGAEAGAVGEGGAPDCADGALRCAGLNPESCQGGQWQASAADCPYACQAGACAGECAAGDGRCEGQVFEQCGLDNLWQTGSACKWVCDAAQGCIGNCAPGTLKCQSTSELDQCSAQGAFVAQTCDLECDVVSGTAECVECTSGDGLCVGGCTHPEDSDCPVDSASGCPNLYFGLGRYKVPQPKDFSNTSIEANPTLKVGVGLLVGVTLYNHGDTSPPASLELFWCDPSDGCLAKPARQIGVTAPFGTGIPGGTALPPTEGIDAASFGWTPDATVLATNGGHVSLLARANMLTAPTAPAGCLQQIYNTQNPATDPRSAVFDVQIVP